MACPSTRNFDDWLRDLSQWRGMCQSWIGQEWENKCNDPVEWKEGDIPGFNPGIVSSQKQLASLRGWKIMNPPEHTTIEGQVAVNINHRNWNPKNVRLSDAGVIYALLTLPADYRIRYLTYDFDNRGDVRKERVPRAPTVAFYQNNQRTLVTWKGVYIFTGGYNDAGWLLANNYPDGPPFFQAGLVVASSHVKTFDALNVQMTEYEPKKVFIRDSNSMENLWKRAYRRYGILLRGCKDVSGYCLVLAGQNISGYQKMSLLFGFNILIGPGADATDTNEAIQQDQRPSTAWKNKLFPDTELKRQPNDFINFIGIRWGHLPIRTRTIETNTTEAITAPHKRKRPNSVNQTQSFLPFSSHSSSAGSEATNERSPDRPVDNFDKVSFKSLWAELAAIESPPRHWELFTAVGKMETMHQRWRRNCMAVKIIQHNVSPSEATVIRELMQTLSPRLGVLILGVEVEEDRIALENAFSYNSAMTSFEQQVNALGEGLVKQAYMNFYTYFQTVGFRRYKIPQPPIKLEQQEEIDSGLRSQDPQQYNEVQRMIFWRS
ncbi:hypothetical protein PEX1_009010 [Penicillium expansum]|uniref:Uncharacterized protein n=1 Tax=Penicillium expansum TaxID=27334 RepID=A0A0A2KKN5_PENEN|nr:hypothetical protein PEX2_080120 [Penicillium expansum]KGO56405.1 hypothetical protein PEX2_080120 [Penicillium expansum]KGO64910.1 hypothetical protein PEX1_009010 [Penicillium expansum]